MPSSRPPPLTLGSQFRVSSSATSSPSSETSNSRSFSSDLYLLSPTSTLSPSSSYSGATVTDSGTARKSPGGCHSSKRKVNANSYCGRHSDEFLFGGHGLGDLWRSLKKKE